MMNLSQLARKSLHWIVAADEGKSEVELLLLARQLFDLDESRSVHVWRPYTTKAAIMFYDGTILNFVSAGVSPEKTPYFVTGWRLTERFGGRLEMNSSTYEDVDYLFWKSREIFGERPTRFIGHSAGGGFAAAAAHAVSLFHPSQPVQVVTFGGPAVLAGPIPSLPSGSVYARLINSTDPVPGLPYNAHDLNANGRGIVVGILGDNYQPNRFVHGRVDSWHKGLETAPRRSSSPPRSEIATTSDIAAWMSGVDGLRGNPHRSTTYLSYWLEEFIAEALVASITPQIEQDEPQPYNPDFIALERLLDASPERENHVFAGDAAEENMWIEQNIENFPHPMFGGQNLNNPQGINIRKLQGYYTVRFGETMLTQHENAADARIMARSLKNLQTRLTKDRQADPDALAVLVQALAS